MHAQEKLIKTREVVASEIEIMTDGLDDLIIENTTSNYMTVILLDENPYSRSIFFDEENKGTLKVDFKLDFDIYKKQVFRKYITKRLQRAKAIFKIPSNKNVIIYGKTIGVTSKNYNGDINIYIDKGNIRLNRVKQNVFIRLLSGNVFANLMKNKTINVKTNTGKITLNNVEYHKHSYTKLTANDPYDFNLQTMNANVFLISE